MPINLDLIATPATILVVPVLLSLLARDLLVFLAVAAVSGAGFIARAYLHVADGSGNVPRGLYVGHVGRHLPDTTTA